MQFCFNFGRFCHSEKLVLCSLTAIFVTFIVASINLAETTLQLELLVGDLEDAVISIMSAAVRLSYCSIYIYTYILGQVSKILGAKKLPTTAAT